MDGIGLVKKISRKGFILTAFSAAVIIHLLILSINIGLKSSTQLTQQKTLSISIYKEEEPKIEEKVSKPEPQITQQPSKNTSPKPEQTVNVISKASSEQNPKVTLPSINSPEFRRFLYEETQKTLSREDNSVEKFAETFILLSKPKVKDTKRDNNYFEGGTFNVVRNGIECESLKSTLQSFDELTGVVPRLVTSGKCRKLNKKINLTDKDGKIKNSDRYDWN